MSAAPSVAVALTTHDDGTITGATAGDDAAPTGRRWERADPDEAASALGELETAHRPRWVWWDRDTARTLARLGVRPARGWDLAAVHRLLHGGWDEAPGRVWAAAHDLDVATVPEHRPADLFSTLDEHDPERPVRDDGHLDPGWASGSWSDTAARAERWAGLARRVHDRQLAAVEAMVDRPALRSTVRSESTASLLAAELEVDGLPFDRARAEEIIAGFVGPRPRDATHAAALLAGRDEAVLRHVPDGAGYDLRSPEQVRSLLRRCGVEVPDTRSWRLEGLVDAHPVVAPLLEWRRAERIGTTFGYGWIDEHVAPARHDGEVERLRGTWSSSDGAAGRMTATAGLHNMPAELRPAVVADPGHLMVRADLGQIEPRVLAAVSGDELLAAATTADDMYAPVADRLRVGRDVAKVAVLGAMYGQTTGVGAAALRGLERAYPVAMGHLRSADEAAQVGRDLRTVGGRLVRMSGDATATLDPDGVDAPRRDDGDGGAAHERADRARAAARGRYGRNAIVQGAAAELFKVWAVLVRARCAGLGASIVLCLHDELLVHAPADVAEETARLVDECLEEAAVRWRPPGSPRVRFLADTSIVERWSDVV